MATHPQVVNKLTSLGLFRLTSLQNADGKVHLNASCFGIKMFFMRFSITFWVVNLAQIYFQRIPNRDMQKMCFLKFSKRISRVPVIWVEFSSHIRVA